MASTQNQTLWGFLAYAKGNPHSSLNSVHWDEIDKMAEMYCTTNTSDADTLTTTDPATYSAAQDFPKKGPVIGSADGAGVAAVTATTHILDQSQYPQDHHAIAE